MVFTSTEFVVFFVIFYIGFIVVPHRFRLHYVLAASLFFFGHSNPSHLWLLILTIALSYFAGIAIAADPTHRKFYLVATVSALLGLLAFFKYTDFAISLFNSITAPIKPGMAITPLGILLPIGISFFVFQAISYVVDVYRGDKQVERNFLVLALFKGFFPQLVAGPIERSTNLLPNIRRAFIDGSEKDLVSSEGIRIGSQLILLGFFKKVCVADNLALFADNVFATPDKFGSFAVMLGVYCFAFQIYCDFSGYSDIARGISRLMGIDLMENFRRPYFSRSIREFWTRWHISLSSWFRDYVFKPLGGSRVGVLHWAANIMAIFLISGLWHGAAVNFIIWGGIHGLIYLAENAVGKGWRVIVGANQPLYLISGGAMASVTACRLRSLAAVIATFHVACFAWIFFRARTFDEALSVLRAIFNGGNLTGGLDFFATTGFAWCAVMTLALILVDVFAEWRFPALERAFDQRTVRWLVYGLAAFAIVFLGNWNAAQQFIYFQF